MKRRIALLPLMAIASTAIAIPAKEAETGTAAKDTTKVIDIEEVVVIATPKENSRLRQQPLSATSFSQNDLRNGAVTSVKALSAFVPNLFIPDYGSKLTTSVYVRGIGSRINTPAIGLYVDNIPFIDKSAFDFNYSDIERIDVMRGPQGTLYGRNTMGGLIRVFTKSPFTYQGTDLRLSAASYNDYKASVTHYHRISEQVAFSTGFFYEHKGGFFKNSLNNQRIDSDDEFGGRIRAIWLPEENLKLDFTLNYEYTNQGGYPYQYTGRTDDKEEDRGEYIGKIAYNQTSGYKRNLLNGGLNLEHQADNFTLSSVTGFQYLYDQMNLDQDFTETDLYALTQKQNSKTLSEEVVLKSKAGRRWQWTTGVSAFYQWLATQAPVTFQQDGINWLNNTINTMANRYMPTISQGPMTMKLKFDDHINGSQLYIPGDFDTPVLNTAVFHQSTFNDLFGAEGLSLTAGLRLDYENLHLDYHSMFAMNHTYKLSGALTPGNREIPMINQSFDTSKEYKGTLKHDYLQLLPKVAVQYRFKNGNNLYASVSKGYRSGGYNIQMFSDLLQNDMQSGMMRNVADVTTPVINGVPMIDDETKQKLTAMMERMARPSDINIQDATLYRPEYSWNYEAGAHLNLFDNRLQTDMALFYMNTRDQQISRFAESGLGRVTVNAGKSRSMGAELSLRSQVTDDFNLYGNYGYTYATFTDYAISETENYNGHYVPFVPKHTFTAGGEYRFIPRKGAWFDNITLNANYKAAGRIYWTEQNNASQALYGTLNGRLSLNKGKGQIALWINNALNKEYQAFYFETMNRGFAQSGRPIQIGVDLRRNF